jgi:hypothetical protein
MNIKKYKILRDIGLNDKNNYSEVPLTKGTVVYRCIYPTYGCISHTGIAVTFNTNGDYPFFEINQADVELG